MPKVGEIMTHRVVTVGPEISLRDVMEILVDEEVTGVPVVGDGRVLGVVSATDILEFESQAQVPVERTAGVRWGEEGDQEDIAPFFVDRWSDVGADVTERYDALANTDWDALSAYSAADVMTRSIRAVPPDATMQEAAAYMRDNGVRRVLVMDGERLVGIVTSTDIVDAVADGRT